jgi:hypothetical protein
MDHELHLKFLTIVKELGDIQEYINEARKLDETAQT